MLEKQMEELYLMFRANYLKNLFSGTDSQHGLSAIESYCLEVIYLLDCPAINEFAEFVNISRPNATYRINGLIEKGYVKKVLSKNDKREYRLEVTNKFLTGYGIHSSFQTSMIKKIKEEFTKEEVEVLDKMIERIVKFDL